VVVKGRVVSCVQEVCNIFMLLCIDILSTGCQPQAAPVSVVAQEYRLARRCDSG
jgi:hypothetical protein